MFDQKIQIFIGDFLSFAFTVHFEEAIQHMRQTGHQTVIFGGLHFSHLAADKTFKRLDVGVK